MSASMRVVYLRMGWVGEGGEGRGRVDGRVGGMHPQLAPLPHTHVLTYLAMTSGRSRK